MLRRAKAPPLESGEATIHASRTPARTMQLPDRIGPFRIVREIGSGGMGVVALARHVESKRTVALKILAPELAKSDEARDRFYREVRAASALDHPAIVPVWEHGECEGLLYFAMRHVEGRPLSELLIEGQGANPPPGPAAERGRVPWIVTVVETCARALHHAHRLKIVHRDIKPSNVLIDAQGEPHLVDFGLAYVEGRHSLTESGRVLGTIPYMAPEIVSGQRTRIDGRTDIFSLGVLLYEALTGARPFEGQTSAEIFQRILFKEPVPPRQRRPEISRDLETIALKCLEKDPDRRYRSALSLAEDLERLRTLQPILARPVGWFGRAQRFARRNPALAAVSLLSCGTVVVLVALLISQILARESAFAQMALALGRARAEQARSQLLADVFESEALLDVERHPFAATSSALPALDAWKERAADLLSRAAIYSAARAGEGEQAEALQGTGKLEEAQRVLGKLETLLPEVRRIEELVRIEFLRLRAEHAAAWERVIGELAEDPRFTDVDLTPVEGIVPLGRNEVGLQEFWHFASGERPPPRSGGGWELEAESGIVLVLLPPGRFAMGPRANEPPEGGLFQDEETRAATDVPAFLLSRYELTQGQWLRAWHENPSQASIGMDPGTRELVTPTHPVEMITWENAQEWARRMSLRLPTELEWEYAARSGGDRYYAGSDDTSSLEGAENVADEAFRNAPFAGIATWNDGYALHAPVGTYRPNAFGLHDLLGNVSEWTADSFAKEYPTDGRRPPESREKAHRGGSWYYPLHRCRATYRQHTVQGNAAATMGARLALDVNGSKR